MVWKLVEIEQGPELPDIPWEIGECFRVPIAYGKSVLDEIMPGWRGGLSTNFLYSGRDFVWAIVMPIQRNDSSVIWVPDIRQKYQEFKMTGDHAAETMTVTPKINLNQEYQGQILSGFITDNELET